jgi:hypothetical protein
VIRLWKCNDFCSREVSRSQTTAGSVLKPKTRSRTSRAVWASRSTGWSGPTHWQHFGKDQRVRRKFGWPSPQFSGRLGAVHGLEIPLPSDREIYWQTS